MKVELVITNDNNVTISRTELNVEELNWLIRHMCMNGYADPKAPEKRRRLFRLFANARNSLKSQA